VDAGREWPDSHSLFLASPPRRPQEKSKQKEGDRRLALRVMAQAPSHFVHDKKWETDETRCAQTTSVSDPFSVTHKMQRSQRINVKSNHNTNISPSQL
jgi:hypothetical protein